MENLVIFHQAFDPIVSDDLKIAHLAEIRLNADVAFVPKKNGIAPLKDRLQMMKGAFISEATGSFFVEKEPSKGEGDLTVYDILSSYRKKRPSDRLYAIVSAKEFKEILSSDLKPIPNSILLVYGLKEEIKDLKGWKADAELLKDAKTVSDDDARNLRSGNVPVRVREYIEKNELYYMQVLPKYLTKRRLAHSLSVARLANSIACANHMSDASDAYVAGLLHDIGKSVDENRARTMVKNNFPEYAAMPGYALHQFVGVLLAKKVFGITNERVLDAIEYHCTGKAHMGPLSKVIYAADKIEPGRGYDSSKMIKACHRQYYAGFLYVLKENREFLKKYGANADNALTEECMELYLGEEE